MSIRTLTFVLVCAFIVACAAPAANTPAGRAPAAQAPAAQVPAAQAPAAQAPAAGSSQGTAASQPGRTLVTAIRTEPASLASRAASRGVTTTTTRRMFNATLVIFDQQGQPQPYLAAELPRLQTDSWRVSPDGQMETRYTLKPNLVWHDGAPLTADDFVFSTSVYATPELGTANSPPNSLIDEVLAPDATTIVIRWKRPYAEAGRLAEELPPLPRHILESTFQEADPDAFMAHPFWTGEYVGAGPFRMEKWEPGASIEGVAFDRHVLGTAKISRVRLVFLGDPNATVANMLAGEVHFSADDSIRFQQGVTLRQQWGSSGGSVLVKPNLWRSTFVQLRPEVMSAPGLADRRARAALALTVDKQGLSEALFDGQGLLADVPLIPNSADYYAAVEPSATKYPFNPGQAQTLLTEAGYTRGGDGVWASPTAGRLALALTTTGSSQNEAELSILGSGWRQAGFEVAESIMPLAMAQSGEARSLFPSLQTISIPLGPDVLAANTTDGISRAENRWTGRNRGGWSNPEFDRLSDSFTTSLDQTERVRLIAQMVRIYSEELPSISLFFNPIPLAHVAALKGPDNVAQDSEIAWNIYTWELQ
jgi:peptide/nickel transport system substrate-binding protein